MDSYFYLFIRLLSALFLFSFQDTNRTRSSRAIIGSSLSKKNKLTLHKTQNGEPNYIDYKFFFNFTRSYLPVQNLGDRHPDTIELASWLVHVL